MSTITNTCDGCGREIFDIEMVELRTIRPSDPHDLCCVLAGCQECFGQPQQVENHWNSIPDVMTPNGWERWVETHGASQGIFWLT